MRTIMIKLSLLVSLASVQPALVYAEIHTVLVRDNSFSPNDILITAGDTVAWQTERSCDPEYDDCSVVILHTVTADDFSFSSGAPSESISFSREFVETGEILYHCEVHSEAGQDINSFMNGRITVQTEEEVFKLNAGLNDAWFNPETSGQGFFITVFPEIGVVTLAWFTYETEAVAGVDFKLGDASHRWLTALGTFTNNKSVMDITFTSGGIFDSASEIQRTDGGTITLIFDGCNSGSVEYDIPSISMSGVVPIQRVAEDNISLCEALISE